jgi:hypothetical protein
MLLPLSTCLVSLLAYWIFIRLYPSDDNDGDDNDDLINKDSSGATITIATTTITVSSSTNTSNDYERASYYQSINNTDSKSNYNYNNTHNNNKFDSIDTNRQRYDTYQNTSHHHTVKPHITATSSSSSSESTPLYSIDSEDIPIEYDTTIHEQQER